MTVRHSKPWNGKRRGPAPSPYAEAPKVAEHREPPKIIVRERTPAKPESIAEFAQLAPPLERDNIAEQLLGIPRRRQFGFLALSNPEREIADA